MATNNANKYWLDQKKLATLNAKCDAFSRVILDTKKLLMQANRARKAAQTRIDNNPYAKGI